MTNFPISIRSAMKTLIHLLSFVLILYASPFFAQKVGINIDTPVFDLDIRGIDDTNDGGELQLATPNQTNFLRFFSGRLGDHHPFMAFHDADTFHIVTTLPDWSTYTRRINITPAGLVGIGAQNPTQILDVNGKIRIGDDENPPDAGTIRWNSSTSDFEGYNGTKWVSLTQKTNTWGVQYASESLSLLPSNLEYGGYYGRSLDLDHNNNSIVVGAPLNNKVYVLSKNGSSWVEDTILTASDGMSGDFFGGTSAISGEYIIVGAPYKEVNGNAAQGQCYIFKKAGAVWTEQAILTSSDGEADDNFGSSLDIRGDYAIVGTPFHTVDGIQFQGQVYVFIRDGTNWTETQILTDADTITQGFGRAVAISDSFIVVGTPWAGTGRVYLFDYNWNQTTLVPSIMQNNQSFGIAVDVYENDVIVGAPFFDSGDLTDQGIAYVFAKNGGTWGEQAILTSNAPESEGYFGNDVAIYGNHAVVGAEWEDHSGNPNAGRCYAYHRNGMAWTKEISLSPSDASHEPGDDEFFGHAVCMSDTYILVSAPTHDEGDSISVGKVYVFQK
jgi:hypothetical protein